MNWKQLLNDKRPVKRKRGSDIRSEFEKDADRIFFSYPFRRLQNKTQVIPVPVYDFIHTRLTHSLEVATIGNSLGRIVGRKIIEEKKNKLKGVTEYDFGAIVKAACLAHDIGNPPFGHSGESSISDFFKREEIIKQFGNHFIEANHNKELNEKRWRDFQNFEGNAMGFRIINNPHYHGFNLTYATLATFMKYPCESVVDEGIKYPLKNEEMSLSYDEKEKKWMRISKKKFGFFQSEQNLFKEIAKKVGLLKLTPKGSRHLSWCRHPLTFLVEAADDICYTLMDLEDANRIGKISNKFVIKNLISIAGNEYKSAKTYKALTDNKEKIGYLRGKAIFKLVDEISGLFLQKENDMLEGKFDNGLLKDNGFKYKDSWSNITKLLNNTVYKNYRPVQELEVVGSEVLRGLLSLFIPVVVVAYAHQSDEELTKNPKPKLKTHYDNQLLNILPEQFKLGKEEEDNMDDTEKIYTKMMRVVDYISGMTDTYALQLYRKLKGIDVPRLQNLDT